MPRHPPCTLSSLTTFIDHRQTQGRIRRTGDPIPPGLASRQNRTSRAINKRASLRETGDPRLLGLRRKVMNHLNRTRQKGARRVQGRRKDRRARGGRKSHGAKDPSFLALFLKKTLL
jgi:hypothetical protein